MHISEISGSGGIGSLGGLSQTKSGTVFGDGGFSSANPTLSRASGKEFPQEVKQLQMLLNTLGYGVQVDGVYGAATEAAVKVIQTKMKMTPNGVYDTQLDDAMNHGRVPKSGLAPTIKQATVIATAQPGTVTMPSQMVPYDPQEARYDPGSGVMTQGGFLNTIIFKVKSNPMMFIAGVVALIGGAFLVPKLIARMTAGAKALSPVQVMGLGGTKRKSKKRKSRKTKL